MRAPAPSWVESIDSPTEGDQSAATTWLLYDDQIDLRAPMRRFLRQAFRANNLTGAEMLSEIRAEFNPSYETLTLHSVTIVRDGEHIDALEDADIDFMRLETDMYARVYRGDYLAIVQVRGLESGDRLEYCYTIEGQNPVFGDAVMATIQTFSTPLARRFCRVIGSREQIDKLAVRGPDVAFEKRETPGGCEARLDLRGLPRVEYEAYVPSEFDDQTTMWSYSRFDAWNDVARWAAELYAIPSDDPTVATLAERLFNQTPEAPELAAIAYVQERIRYVSTSFGEGGYRPRAPETIEKRRYGDCKDKALLLSALLRRMGHEADPVLVNTWRRRGALIDPPSPRSFNHVIVRANIGGETHWIDATSIGQRGPLGLRARPFSMAALPIRPDAMELAQIPPLPATLYGDFSKGEIDLSAGVGQPVTMRGELVCVGMDAENIRRQIIFDGVAGLQRMFLDANSEQHGEAEYELFEVRDDEGTNTVRLNHRLILRDPWRSAPGGLREFRDTLCYATTLLPFVPMNGRKRPVALLSHPMHHVHAEKVRLPAGKQPVGFKRDREHRLNEAFEFDRRVSIDHATLEVVVETRTLAPYLSAAAALGALRDQTALQNGHVLHLQFSED